MAHLTTISNASVTHKAMTLSHQLTAWMVESSVFQMTPSAGPTPHARMRAVALVGVSTAIVSATLVMEVLTAASPAQMLTATFVSQTTQTSA
jgi:hypothetical protein